MTIIFDLILLNLKRINDSMITDKQRRNQLLRRISKFSSDKLKELDEYVSKLDQGTRKRNKTMSYAGAWKDIDDSVLEDFTTNLISNRRKNRQRIDD